MALSRGKPMKRGGPLKRTGAPARKTRLSQGTKGFSADPKPLPQKRATARRTAAGATGPKSVDEWTRDALWVRCKGLCEACGKVLNRQVFDAHHRQVRRLGDHSLANLVALHAACHTIDPRSVHQQPRWAIQRGLIVPTWEKPCEVRLLLPGPVSAPPRAVLLDPRLPQYLVADAA